jgi:hypothetical protein
MSELLLVKECFHLKQSGQTCRDLSMEKRIESIKEKLKLYIELLRNLIILLIAVGGGTVGLLFKLSNPVAVPLLLLGITLTVGLIFGIIRIAISIKETLQELKEWEKNS